MSEQSKGTKILKVFGFDKKRDLYILLIFWVVALVLALAVFFTNSDLDADMQGLLMLNALFPIPYCAGVLYAGLIKWLCERETTAPIRVISLVAIWILTVTIAFGVNLWFVPDWFFFFVVDIALVGIFIFEVMMTLFHDKMFYGKDTKRIRIAFVLSYILIAVLFYLVMDSSWVPEYMNYLGRMSTYLLIGAGLWTAIGLVFILKILSGAIYERFHF